MSGLRLSGGSSDSRSLAGRSSSGGAGSLSLKQRMSLSAASFTSRLSASSRKSRSSTKSKSSLKISGDDLGPWRERRASTDATRRMSTDVSGVASDLVSDFRPQQGAGDDTPATLRPIRAASLCKETRQDHVEEVRRLLQDQDVDCIRTMLLEERFPLRWPSLGISKGRVAQHATSLMVAAIFGSKRCAEEIINAAERAEVRREILEARDDAGNCAMHWAARGGQAKVIQVLLDHGAEREPLNEFKSTPVHIACAVGHHNVVQVLLHHRPASVEDGAAFDKQDSISSLTLASGSESLSLTEFQEQLVDLQLRDLRGFTPLVYATLGTAQMLPGASGARAYREIFEDLIDHGADVGVTFDFTDAAFLLERLGSRSLDLYGGRPMRDEVSVWDLVQNNNPLTAAWCVGMKKIIDREFEHGLMWRARSSEVQTNLSKTSQLDMESLDSDRFSEDEFPESFAVHTASNTTVKASKPDAKISPDARTSMLQFLDMLPLAADKKLTSGSNDGDRPLKEATRFSLMKGFRMRGMGFNGLISILGSRTPETRDFFDALVRRVGMHEVGDPPPSRATLASGERLTLGAQTLQWTSLDPEQRSALTPPHTNKDVTVDVRAIILPLQSFCTSEFLFGLSSTPNSALLDSEFVSILCDFLWRHFVRRRFYFDVGCQVASLCALTWLMFALGNSGLNGENAFLYSNFSIEDWVAFCMVVLSVLRDVLALLSLWRLHGGALWVRGRRRLGQRLERLVDLLRLFSTSWLLCSLAVDHFLLATTQRFMMAAACFIRWIHLLLLMRGFAGFGPLILPIINSIRQTTSFVVVLTCILCAIFHAQVAVLPGNPDSWGDSVLNKYRLALHQETVEAPDSGEEMWMVNGSLFFIGSVVVGIYTLNLGISILSSRYDANEELAEREFQRVRCATLGAHVKASWLPKFVLCTQAVKFEEETGSGEVVENDDDVLRHIGRLKSLKNNTASQLRGLERRLVKTLMDAQQQKHDTNQREMRQEFERMEARLDERLSRIDERNAQFQRDMLEIMRASMQDNKPCGPPSQSNAANVSKSTVECMAEPAPRTPLKLEVIDFEEEIDFYRKKESEALQEICELQGRGAIAEETSIAETLRTVTHRKAAL